MKLNLKKYTKKELVRAPMIAIQYFMARKSYFDRLDNGENPLYITIEILLLIAYSLVTINHTLKDIRSELETCNDR